MSAPLGRVSPAEGWESHPGLLGHLGGGRRLDVAVDADDLPRKFTQTMEIPAAGGGKPTTTTTEGTYSDFGTDVEIEAPPTSEVTEQPGM